MFTRFQYFCFSVYKYIVAINILEYCRDYDIPFQIHKANKSILNKSDGVLLCVKNLLKTSRYHYFNRTSCC